MHYKTSSKIRKEKKEHSPIDGSYILHKGASGTAGTSKISFYSFIDAFQKMECKLAFGPLIPDNGHDRTKTGCGKSN